MTKLTQTALKKYGFTVWKSLKFKPKYKNEVDNKHRGKVFSKNDFHIIMYNEDKFFRLEDYTTIVSTCEQLETIYFQLFGCKLT